MANADGGSVLEVKRVSGNGDVPVNVPFRPWSVRHDLDDGFSALDKGIAGNGHVPDHAGFIPAGGVIFHQDGGMPVFSNRHRSTSTGFLVVSRKPLVGMWRHTVLLMWTDGVHVMF